GCMAAEAWVVGDEEPRTLPRHAARPADEATHRLAEKELGRSRRCVDADAKARDVDAFGYHAHGDEPWVGARGELGDAGRRERGVRRDHGRGRPEPYPQQRSDPASVLLVRRDHEPARIGLLA